MSNPLTIVDAFTFITTLTPLSTNLSFYSSAQFAWNQRLTPSWCKNTQVGDTNYLYFGLTE